MPARELRSAGTRKKRSPNRIPWGTLSRPQIIDAASTIVKHRGFEHLTIRVLAAELGASPMSLYNHVRDKDDVLCEVVDRLLASVWQPQAEEADWWKWISEAADRLHTFLVSEPAALHVYLKQPVVSPVALQRMETVLGVLQKSGLNEEEARRAYAAIHTYTVGFSALESSRSHWVPPDDAPELAMQLAGFVSPHQFTSGLRYMLEAIEQRSSSAEGRWLST